MREGLSLHDISDYPVREDYVQLIAQHCDSIRSTSRWFNAIAVEATATQLDDINALPFVSRTQPMQHIAQLAEEKRPPQNTERKFTPLEEATLYSQTERMGYSLLRERGFTGKGVRIAVFDAGFPMVDEHPNFSHIMEHKRIVDTYDFVRKSKNVFRSNNHGTHVLSCIAGMIDTIPMGCATDAEFLLAKTENAYVEVRVEEDHWIQSLEWADKMGADIVNSSLGYTVQFYFRTDMNGQTSIITKAANTAFSKGILVVNSAGNEGTSRWEIIGAPADSDSVLTIGGIVPSLGYHTNFSSYGPTASYKKKPNLVAFSHTVTALGRNQGTSFSSPLVAGFAACIRQMHPEWPVQKLFDELEKSGDLYPYFDYAHGHGVPQASYFIHGASRSDTATFTMHWNSNDEVLELQHLGDTATWNSFALEKENWQENRCYHLPLDFCYWQFLDEEQRIVYYELVEPGEKLIARISNHNYDNGGYTFEEGENYTLRIYYKQYVFEQFWDDVVKVLTQSPDNKQEESTSP
jgi:serine protease AprX